MTTNLPTAPATPATNDPEIAFLRETPALFARLKTELRRRIVGQSAELNSGAEVGRLREERATLMAARDGGRTQAMAALRNRMNLARMDLLHDVGARIRALNATARSDLDRLGRRAGR